MNVRNGLGHEPRLLLTVLSLGWLCACAPGDGGVPDSDPCGGPAPATLADTGTIVVRGEDPPCTLEFVEVVTLAGDPDEGALPRMPIAGAPGGGWVTATYDPGRIAFWSPTGAFERVIGNGPGEGPGEFRRASELVVDTLAGRVYVFSSSPRIVVYSLAGEYLSEIQVPGPAMAGAGIVLSDGTLVVTTSPPTTEPELVVIRGDHAERIGPAQRGPVFPPMLLAAHGGVWSAEGPWYEIDHHAMPDGHVDFRIRREGTRFPVPSDEDVRNASGAILSGFTINEGRGTVLAMLAHVHDPDAPRAPMPQPTGPDEGARLQREYFDGVVEAFSLDGRLIATAVWDYWRDAPSPLGSPNPSGQWYSVLDDATRSIRILRPVLYPVEGAR